MGVMFQVLTQRNFTAMKKIAVIVLKNAIEFVIHPLFLDLLIKII